MLEGSSGILSELFEKKKKNRIKKEVKKALWRPKGGKISASVISWPTIGPVFNVP